MASATSKFTIEYGEYYDERVRMETSSRGYLGDVVVRFEDGVRYQLFFYDPVRLVQDLARCGQPVIAEPNMVVIPEVTEDTIQAAVEVLRRAISFSISSRCDRACREVPFASFLQSNSAIG